MRRLFLVVLAVSALIVLSIIGFTWFTRSTGDDGAQLIIESGTVQVKHAGGSWASAQDGMLLHQSDSVKTGNNSSAAIVLFKSSIIRLDSNTEVQIQELLQQAGETSVKVQQDVGRTWNTIQKISGIDNYDTQTPTTVASIRGTSFVVIVYPNGTTDIIIISGNTTVSSIKNGEVVYTIMVNESQAVTVDPAYIDLPLETKPFGEDGWILQNMLKDEEFLEQVKADLYERIEPYIPELKERYGVTDEELDALLEGYLYGYYDLPPETPDWVRDIIELS